MSRVVGLDLSLTSSGVVVVQDWWHEPACGPECFWCGTCPGFQWGEVEHRTFGSDLPATATERERALRRRGIADEIVRVVGPGAHVYVEGFSYANQHPAVAELAGVVKDRLLSELDVAVEAVPPLKARKLFLGRCPKGSKKLVSQALERTGAPFANEDECDAFVVANWGRHARGLPAMHDALGSG